MRKQRKTAGKYAAKKKSNKGLKIAIALVALLLVALAALMLTPEKTGMDTQLPTKTQTDASVEVTQTEYVSEQPSVNLGYGIYLTDVGSYTGLYMEDGSDEIVSGILMMVVKNTGDQDIQYAEITMDIGEQKASFSLTTLPVGESMVLLEKDKMTWDDGVDYDAILPKVETIAYFQDSITTLEETLKIQIVDGAINVTNISGEDIADTITVYYKNAAEDLLYGGITYRVSIQGGLKADELRQIMTQHASDTGSRIMFATIAE